jgi:hypothetical protein
VCHVQRRAVEWLVLKIEQAEVIQDISEAAQLRGLLTGTQDEDDGGIDGGDVRL